MSIKLITILKEALDVSWNPFGEDYYKFKIGDKARESNGDQESCKILDRRPDWNGVIKNPIDKAYINNGMWQHHDYEIDNQPWYLVKWLEHNSEMAPQWYTESDLDVFESINEALDVSWNPYEEGNSEFKIGDKVYEVGSENPGKVIDLAPDFLTATKTVHFEKPVNWGEEYEYDFWYLVHYPLMDLFQWYPEEYLTKEPSAPELDETLDVSWNPYEESNHLNKFYEFVDYDYSEDGPTALVFFKDEDENDLRTIVDLETEKILDASEWSGESDKDVDLDPKIVEQLNQNEYIKDILRRWAYHIKKNRFDEALDVSWNPFEDHDYTVLMGKLDGNDAIVRHFTTKDEDSALLEFFMEYLGQNINYAKTAISGLKEKTPLKNGIAYKANFDDFFWIVAKGEYNQNQMTHLSKEYRQKRNK